MMFSVKDLTGLTYICQSNTTAELYEELANKMPNIDNPEQIVVVAEGECVKKSDRPILEEIPRLMVMPNLHVVVGGAPRAQPLRGIV